jgi:hypothetical protein
MSSLRIADVFLARRMRLAAASARQNRAQFRINRVGKRALQIG